MSRSEIRCLPRGVCTWRFHLKGTGHEAEVDLRGMRDQGRVLIDDEHEFEVARNTMFGRSWTMHGADGSAASAEKLPLRRSFELRALDGSELRLEPESLFGRSLSVQSGTKTLATIRPDHAFTRRATIEVARKGLDFPTACFAFWLAAMTWRRRARSS